MKSLRYILLLVLAGLLVAGIVWSRGKARDEKCRKIYVEIANTDSTTFVTANGVMAELARNGITLKGKRAKELNLDRVEKLLAKSQYLESAECVLEPNGVVRIKVKQIVPVMRIFDSDSTSYYVNRHGKRMTANANFHADVPIVRGPVPKGYDITKLLPMMEYVERDSTLRQLVTMYDVADTNNIIIVPSITGHVVNVGNGQNCESMFAKLQLFYRDVMPKRGWATFDTISVKWNHQVVATRKNKHVDVKLEVGDECDTEADVDINQVMSEQDKALGVVRKANGQEKAPEQKKPPESKKKN